jgi:hypothetical protein
MAIAIIADLAIGRFFVWGALAPITHCGISTALS